MSVLKGLAFFFFVLAPGITIAAYIGGLGVGAVFVGAGLAASWCLQAVGVPEAEVWTVGGTLAVAAFIALCAVALRSDTSNRL